MTARPTGQAASNSHTVRQTSLAAEFDSTSLVVYHGTNAHAYSAGSIDTFNTRPPSGRGAAFFTSDISLAAQYGEAVYAATLIIQNPLVVICEGQTWSTLGPDVRVAGSVTDALLRAFAKRAEEADRLYAELNGLPPQPDVGSGASKTLDGLNLGAIPRMSGFNGDTDSVVKEARKLGFDGVVFRDIRDHPTADRGYADVVSDVFAVFDAAKISLLDAPLRGEALRLELGRHDGSGAPATFCRGRDAQAFLRRATSHAPAPG